MAKAFIWQLEEFPRLPAGEYNLTMVLVFKLTLNNLHSKWHCTFTNYKQLEERLEEAEQPFAISSDFKDEGHIPFNNSDFMAFMLCAAQDCPIDHVAAFYWDLTTGNLIEYEYISYH